MKIVLIMKNWRRNFKATHVKFRGRIQEVTTGDGRKELTKKKKTKQNRAAQLYREKSGRPKPVTTAYKICSHKSLFLFCSEPETAWGQLLRTEGTRLKKRWALRKAEPANCLISSPGKGQQLSQSLRLVQEESNTSQNEVPFKAQKWISAYQGNLEKPMGVVQFHVCVYFLFVWWCCWEPNPGSHS